MLLLLFFLLCFVVVCCVVVLSLFYRTFHSAAQCAVGVVVPTFLLVLTNEL